MELNLDGLNLELLRATLKLAMIVEGERGQGLLTAVETYHELSFLGSHNCLVKWMLL